MNRFIARSPILDRFEKVYGYELLPRPGGEEIWPPKNDGPTGGGVSLAALTFEEMEKLADGTRAFVKCSREALIGGYAACWPADQVVMEVRASREPDPQLVAACRELKDAGFRIALQNYTGAWEEPLAELADIIKLDVTALTDRAQWLFIRKYRPKGTMIVAEKVETRTQLQAAVQQGFTYFQGHFYLKAQPYSAYEVTPAKLVYLLVLGAVTRPEIDIEEVTRTIKHDLALSYKLLRFLNSARFAFHSQIKSIRHALLLLGQNELRKWIGLISVAALGEGGPPILVATALIRGAFCEYLAPLLGEAKRQSDYFFLGLLSSIDVLLRRPMRVILGELPIAPDVRDALMGEQNRMRDVLQAVLSYEQGNWEDFSLLASKLALQEDKLCDLYRQALQWSRELTQAEKDEPAEIKCS
jgi:EAL and modified HD-GYP domain-containing signal transduction protein